MNINLNMSFSFENKWLEMKPIVLKLLQQAPVSQKEWHNLFYTCHNICLWDRTASSRFRKHLHIYIEDYIKNAQQRIMAHQENQALLLKAYTTEWKKFIFLFNYLPVPFKSIDFRQNPRIFFGDNKFEYNEYSVLQKFMIHCWHKIIFYNLQPTLQIGAMELVNSELNGRTFDSQLVIGVRETYVYLSKCSAKNYNKLKIYKRYFERGYLSTITSFYIVKAPEYLELHGVKKYLRYVDSKLREEEVRAQKYLDTSGDSVSVAMITYVSILVSKCYDTIVAEFTDMIKNNDVESLTLMFKFLDRSVEGISKILKDLEEYIVCTGLMDMMASKHIITQNSEKYVEQLLILFNKSSSLVHKVFNDDPRFLTTRDKAYEKLVNDTTVFQLELPTKQFQPESKCPELIANYCDMLLRKTALTKRLTADEIECKLKDVLLVLKYVQNKDVFMAGYKAHLTRRLILDTSVDSDKEENMIGWLREIGMPADYIIKLARMFQDIKLCEDLNQQFKETCKDIKGKITDSINIKILNAGAWSQGSEHISVSLPRELEDYIPEIEDFYRKKHSGRILKWYHHMSNGTITFSNDVGQFDVNVTTFQMSVLFIWNQRSKDKISYEDLKLATGLTDPELRRTLWSLVAFPKLKKQIVLVSPYAQSPKDLNENSTFWINEQFSIVKNGKLKNKGEVNLIGRLQLTTQGSKDEDNKCIIHLRILRVQEAIIKILKMRKQISSWNLQIELIEKLKNMFLPSKKMIKEQIEWLIEQNYMKRDEDNIDNFVYCA